MDGNDLTRDDLVQMTETYLGLRDVAQGFTQHYEPDSDKVQDLIMQIGRLDASAAGTAAVLALAVGILESLLSSMRDELRARENTVASEQIDRVLREAWDDFEGREN